LPRLLNVASLSCTITAKFDRSVIHLNLDAGGTSGCRCASVSMLRQQKGRGRNKARSRHSLLAPGDCSCPGMSVVRVARRIVTRLPSFNRANGAYFRGMPCLAKINPDATTSQPMGRPGIGDSGRLCVIDACLCMRSVPKDQHQGLRYPKIIPAGQSSLAGFGKRQRAWPVAADAFDIGT
jgi:hypothetical protein